MLTALASGSGAAPVWVALVAAALALLGTVATGVMTYMNGRRTNAMHAIANELTERANTAADRADKREEWWKRAQWAMERAYDKDQLVQAVGLTVLEALGTSDLADDAEQAMLVKVSLVVITGGVS